MLKEKSEIIMSYLENFMIFCYSIPNQVYPYCPFQTKNQHISMKLHADNSLS